MRGHVEMKNVSSVVGKHDENIENVERNVGYGEEVDRDQLRRVIVEKRSPCLQWRFRMPYHVFCNRRFGNMDSEFQKFTVNSGRTPDGVVPAHGADQAASFL